MPETIQHPAPEQQRLVAPVDLSTLLRVPLAGAFIAVRPGGTAVTVLQLLTLFAFLAALALLRPLAWATAAASLYAIWDYQRVGAAASRPVGS